MISALSACFGFRPADLRSTIASAWAASGGTPPVNPSAKSDQPPKASTAGAGWVGRYGAEHASSNRLSWEIEVGMDTEQRFKVRIGRLLEKGSTVLRTHSPNPPHVMGFPTLAPGALAEWRAQSLSLLTELLGADHVYTTDFVQKVGKGYTSCVEAGLGILRAVDEDLEEGTPNRRADACLG